MSHRVGCPKPNARERTISRWLDPMNRTINKDNKLIPSANPNCTGGRNPDRFNNRPTRLAERHNG